MYARKFSFKAKSGSRSEVEKIADQAFGIMKSLDGFISLHILISEDDDEYGSFSLWDSEENAKSGGDVVRSKTGVALTALAVEPPSVKVYEVYKPRSSV